MLVLILYQPNPTQPVGVGLLTKTKVWFFMYDILNSECNPQSCLQFQSCLQLTRKWLMQLSIQTPSFPLSSSPSFISAMSLSDLQDKRNHQRTREHRCRKSSPLCPLAKSWWRQEEGRKRAELRISGIISPTKLLPNCLLCCWQCVREGKRWRLPRFPPTSLRLFELYTVLKQVLR